MSQTDPQTEKKKTKGTQEAAGAKKPAAAKASSTKKPSGELWIVALAVIAIAAAGISAWVLRPAKSSPPVASAAEEEDDFAVMEDPFEDGEEEEEETEPTEPTEPEAAPPVRRAPASGSLVIESAVEGADVFLNGKRVGTTPHRATGLKPGSYDVKVEKEGYTSFTKKVKVAAKRNVLRADLAPAVATLHVEANVSDARISLDGDERGGSPATFEELEPGHYELIVAASGYKTHRETLDLEGGKVDIKVELVSPLEGLNEAVAVKHKHRLGSCEGVLRATADGVVYESEHKDAFSVDLGRIEEFELDGDELTLKVQGGRKYDFEERNENAEALASFHGRVGEAVDAVGAES